MRSEAQATERYVANSIKGAQHALQRADVIGAIGEERAEGLQRTIERCRPTLPVDGIIDLSTLGDEIPVTAVSVHDEKVFYSVDGSSLFTSAGKQKVDESLEAMAEAGGGDSWPSAADILDAFTQYVLDLDDPEAGTHGIATGFNGSTFATRMSIIPLDPDITDTTPLLRLMARPAMLIEKTTDKRLDPDVFSHELTHVKQKEERPVRVYSSQEEVDMDGLADEQEAYFVGAAVRKAISNLTGERYEQLRRSSGGAFGPKYMQLRIDNIRVENCDPDDPLAPTPALLQAYVADGIPRGNMISSKFNFDGTRKAFVEQAES